MSPPDARPQPAASNPPGFSRDLARVAALRRAIRDALRVNMAVRCDVGEFEVYEVGGSIVLAFDEYDLKVEIKR